MKRWHWLALVVVLLGGVAVAQYGGSPGGTDNPIFTSNWITGAPGVFPGSGCTTYPGGGRVCGDNLGGVQISALDGGGAAINGGGGATFTAGAFFDGGATFPPFAPIYLGVPAYNMTPDNEGDLLMRFIGVHLISGWFQSDVYVQTPVLYSTGPAITVYAPIVADAGEYIGGGTLATNHCIGVCGLASQTCNVVCPGATGNSVCHGFLLGPNTNILSCDVTADAGSATVKCGAATAGDAGVECWN